MANFKISKFSINLKFTLNLLSLNAPEMKTVLREKKTLKMTSAMQRNKILKTVHSDWCINLNDYKESLMFVLLGP